MKTRRATELSPLRLGRRFAQQGREQARDREQAPRRIVLTGGPGGGKSTATSFLSREFAKDLWVVPEVATLVYRGGLPRGTTPRGIRIAQRAIFDMQRALEESHVELDRARIQLCDRGSVDGAAYWPDGPDAFFAALGTSHETELARYDAVIFLHSAATLDAGYHQDIETRTEERELALELDRRVFALYESHPNVVVIPSSGSFLKKLATVTEAVQRIVNPSDPALSTIPRSALAPLDAVKHLLPTR